MRRLLCVFATLAGLNLSGAAMAQTPSGGAQDAAATQGTAGDTKSASSNATTTGTAPVGGATPDGVEAAKKRLDEWRSQREALKQSASGFQR